jgi:hypothetical protein
MDEHDGDLPDLQSDADEDETLRYAIALSLREHRKADPDAVAAASTASAMGSRQDVSFGSLQLDRKAMEEERLKRLAAKRPRASSPGTDDEVVEVEPPKKKRSSGVTPATKGIAPMSALQKSSARFYDGVVKRTWAYGYPRTPDDIKIEEVLQKDSLELALLSSYQWDDEWLLSKIDLRKTKLLLVAFAKDEASVCDRHSSRAGHPNADYYNSKMPCAKTHRQMFASAFRPCEDLAQCTPSCSC